LKNPSWKRQSCAACYSRCKPGKHWISVENYTHWIKFRRYLGHSYICDREMTKLQFQCCDYFDSTYQVQKRDLGLFQKLSMDILPFCFSFCDAFSLCHLSQTSKSMHNLIMSEPIWKKFSEQHFPHFLYDPMSPFLMNSPIICGYKHATLTYTHFERAVTENTNKIFTSSSNQLNWDSVVNQLPLDECNFMVFRFFPDITIRHSIVFVLWAPSDAKTKNKMLIAGVKDSVKKALPGITWEVGSTDHDELCWDGIYERIKNNY